MRKKLALLLVSTAVALGVAEVVLRAVTDYPDKRTARTTRHPALGHVMRAAIEGIDKDGFRNPDGLGSVDLVAIGDSHTYGYNVERVQSWPAVAAAERGLSVYIYALGGYGLLHYRWLFDEALRREPKHVIVGLYLANDLADYCRYARRSFWRPRLEQLGFNESACPERRRAPKAELLQDAWLATALGSAVDEGVWQPLSERHWRDGVLTVEHGDGHRTLLDPRSVRRHGRVMDLERPEVAEAFQVLELAFAEMADAAHAAGVELGVLLIPSKENALLAILDQGVPGYDDIVASVRTERDLVERTERRLAGLGIATADPLPCLRDSVTQRLYPWRLDGHPLAAGYRCYAYAADQLLEAAPRQEGRSRGF